ncbi:MAG: signal peptidase I [Candidatus Helarchaeota archaeon]|nr:signal peptidase I [Candidatus Helarchaeota archaeon]
MTESRKKSIIKTLIIIGIIVGGLVGGFFILCAACNTDTPITVVEGNSMIPTLSQGDIIFLQKPRDLGDVQNGSHTEKTGDILVYYSSYLGFLVIHRVIDKKFENGTWYFNTQGDNDDLPDNQDIYHLPGDAYLPEDYVKGVMIGRIPWIGNIGIFLRDSGIGIFLIVIILAYLIISSFFDSKSSKSDKKDDKKDENL